MSQAVRRPPSYDDVLRAPENHIAQVLDGELHVHPRPARKHTRAASSLGARLLTEFDAGHRDEGGDWII